MLGKLTNEKVYIIVHWEYYYMYNENKNYVSKEHMYIRSKYPSALGNNLEQYIVNMEQKEKIYKSIH